MGTGSRADVREFKRDVSSADKEDSFWQMLQFEKLLTRHGVFGAGNFQIAWFRSRRYNDIGRLQNVVATRTDKGPVKCALPWKVVMASFKKLSSRCFGTPSIMERLNCISRDHSI